MLNSENLTLCYCDGLGIIDSFGDVTSRVVFSFCDVIARIDQKDHAVILVKYALRDAVIGSLDRCIKAVG